MKKIVTFAVVTGGALALAACGAKKEEAPAEPAAEEMMMPEGETPAPVAEETPAGDATPASPELEETGNPILPG